MSNQKFPPRTTEIAGQPHLLSYITPEEAGILKLLGGAGKAGPMGIPSFYDEGDDYGGPGGDSFADASGGQTSGMSDSDLGYSGGGGNSFSSDDDSPSYSEVQEAINQAKSTGKTLATVTNIGGDDGDDYNLQITDQFGNTSFRDQFGNYNNPVGRLANRALNIIGFDPKKSLQQNLYDTVVPGQNTPLGILSPVITTATGGLSDAAKLGISLGNYFAGQSEPLMDFVSSKIGPKEAQEKMGTYDFSNVVDETMTRPDLPSPQSAALSNAVQNQVDQAIQSTTGSQTGDITREGIMEALGVPTDTPQTEFGQPYDTSFFDTQTNVFGTLSAPLEFLDNNLMKKGKVYTSGSTGGITGGNKSSGIDIGKMADTIGDVIGYGYYRNQKN